MAESGNQYVGSDFLRVMLTLKDSTMKSTHVAGIYKVTSVTEQVDYSTYMCANINDSTKTLEAIALSGLEIAVNDFVVVLFCDDDFRANYRRLKANKDCQTSESSEKHSLSYGIIIGLV